ncbi:hypothetical protein [Mesobacillus harenae]|uniref:hypothetical protein n=1 Tax=Mesobacillus harenae TaxID=2213203 RepID=UPI00157FD082|nr:hypothetical protein [Mesobacillus harenae]
MSHKNNIKPAFFLILLLGFTAYLESPYSFIHSDYALFSSVPTASVPEYQMPSSNGPELEWIKEKEEIVNGYMVETYREFEISKDASGMITKKEPTNNYDYIRYKVDSPSKKSDVQ